MKNLIFLIGFLIQITLFSCVTTSKVDSNVGFTSENIIKIKKGMTSFEIIQLFGNPVGTETTLMGAETSKPWQAIEWHYDKSNRYKRVFAFQEINGTLYLQAWFNVQ